jgi:HAE1 family hydrophobic/amphiphilic exporter-1
LRDVENLRARSTANAMVPLGAVATFKEITGPYRVPRYNLFPAAEVQGSTRPGFSTGQAIAAMEKITADLPVGFGFEWTEIAYQEKVAGNTAGVAFGLAVVFVFLLLAAQYESILLPLAVILIVPMCLFAAISGVSFRGMDNNILTQIGFVVLIGLAAKNAVLIVEFAKQQQEHHGMKRRDAAVSAAKLRLRPILMTSFAFILGVVPLVIAKGAGHEMRQQLGTAVFSGMIGVTFCGIFLTPMFYVALRGLSDLIAGHREQAAPQPQLAKDESIPVASGHP